MFKENVLISIRAHCIPASDELRRMEKVGVNTLPGELALIPEKAAGDVVKKFFAYVESDFFKSLPDTATIHYTGIKPAFIWRKSEVIEEYNRIKNDLCA